ncbi:hypothetical protein Sm713_56540 [Streptomyces sp. TS71-3]|nr:hypothetical protein Sm713_56540 [Streptomyces sp. TS71-3]
MFVPVAVEPLRRLLADPGRVAAAVPGLQQDAGGPPVSGRLKVRVGGTSITYRGALRITERDDGSYLVEGDAAEARGGGTVTVALTLRLTAADGGTTLAFTGHATGGGRFADLDTDVAETAGRRLFNKIGGLLAESAGGGANGEGAPGVGASEAGASGEGGSGSGEGASGEGASGEGRGEADERGREEAQGESPEQGPLDEHDEDGEQEARRDELGVPLPDAVDAALAGETRAVFEVDNQPPAEAAHARRTMIGRSAEEVDHAPPRGRYAPVPAPESTPASIALRWAAPAAAVALASAIVIGRALRRRR